MQDPLESQETPAEDAVVEENEETSAAAENGSDQKETQDPAAEGDGLEEDCPEKPELSPEEALEIELAKWKDQAVRTAAELDNYRKRMAREKLDAVRYGNQRLLEDLLPVLDNFDMGMQAAAQEEGSMLYMGMDMVRKQIAEFFSAQNVEDIPAEAGADFDHALHEAISQEASDEIEAGKIIRVVRKGYRIGERLLRPSNVTVSLGPDTNEE